MKLQSIDPENGFLKYPSCLNDDLYEIELVCHSLVMNIIKGELYPTDIHDITRRKKLIEIGIMLTDLSEKIQEYLE